MFIEQWLLPIRSDLIAYGSSSAVGTRFGPRMLMRSRRYFLLRSAAPSHGAEGQGNPGTAKVLKVEIKHLGSADIEGKTADDLCGDCITEGVGKI